MQIQTTSTSTSLGPDQAAFMPQGQAFSPYGVAANSPFQQSGAAAYNQGRYEGAADALHAMSGAGPRVYAPDAALASGGAQGAGDGGAQGAGGGAQGDCPGGNCSKGGQDAATGQILQMIMQLAQGLLGGMGGLGGLGGLAGGASGAGSA